MVRFTSNTFDTSASVLMSSGTLSSDSGAWKARRSGASTLTVMVASVWLPLPSVAVQVTVFAPRLLPASGAQVTVTA